MSWGIVLSTNILHHVVTESDSGWFQAFLLSLNLSLDKIISTFGFTISFKLV